MNLAGSRKPDVSRINSSNCPLVSVIVPIFNRLDFFEECIGSVADQSYRPIEVLIVDDGSDQDTRTRANALVRKFLGRNLHIEIIYKSNGGAPSARNCGLHHANGEFIQFLDSDDILLPEKISVQIQEFQRFPDTDIVYSKSYITDQNLRPFKGLFGTRLTEDGRDLASLRWQTGCSLTKRTSFKKIGEWNESLKKGQEFELNLRALLTNAKIRFVDIFLSAQRCHNQGHMGASLGQGFILRANLSTYRVCLAQIRDYGRLDLRTRKAWFQRCGTLVWAFGSLDFKNDRDTARSLINEFGLETNWLKKIIVSDNPKWLDYVLWKISRRVRWLDNLWKGRLISNKDCCLLLNKSKQFN